MVMKSWEAPMMAMERGLKKRSMSVRISGLRWRRAPGWRAEKAQSYQARGVARLPFSVGADEALHALAAAHLGRIEVARRVHGEIVQPVELAGAAPEAAEARQALATLARDDVDLAVGAVADEEIALLRVG